jgi:hypothetical protein
VFRKRLLRLALAPGLLPYTVLALVIGLIWLQVGDRPPPQTPAAPAPCPAGPGSALTYRPAEPDGTLIALDQAIDSARRFADEPGLLMEGGLQRDPTDPRIPDIYYLESGGPNRGEDIFKVDARTAEVIEATFRSRLAPTNPPVGLGPLEAERAASRYARERFFGFDDLRLVDQSSRPSEGNVIHSFKWSQIAPESRAELPISVSVAISAGSGEVVWYLAQRDPILIDVHPTIDQARAVAAVKGALGHDARWDTASPTAVRLQVLYDDDNRQQLVWSVTFRSRLEGTRPTLRLLVNAHTGQLMAGPS